jgi:hypothetical protein
MPDKLSSSSVGDGADLALFKVAYEEGKRLVDDQVAELDSMRQRSVQFLAFVGSATSFLVGTSLPGTTSLTSGQRVVAASATVLSFGSIILVALILLSLVWGSRGTSSAAETGGQSKPRFLQRIVPARVQWHFRLDPLRLVTEWPKAKAVQQSKTEMTYYGALAKQYSSMSTRNKPALRTLRTYYWMFICATALQVTAWSSLAWLSR